MLFTNSGFTSSRVMFDLDYKSYSIATALAEQGFDVYLMDHTGFGRSPRPTMDDPCNVDPSQQQLLIPKPLVRALRRYLPAPSRHHIHRTSGN